MRLEMELYRTGFAAKKYLLLAAVHSLRDHLAIGVGLVSFEMKNTTLILVLRLARGTLESCK